MKSNSTRQVVSFLEKYTRVQGKNKLIFNAIQPTVHRMNAQESSLSSLSDQQLVVKSDEFKNRLVAGETLDDPNKTIRDLVKGNGKFKQRIKCLGKCLTIFSD